MIRKLLANLVLVAVPAVWLYVFYRIDGEFSFSGFLMAAFLSAISYVILYLLFVIAYRLRVGVPLIEAQYPEPRKLPLWYRILSRFFR